MACLSLVILLYIGTTKVNEMNISVYQIKEERLLW